MSSKSAASRTANARESFVKRQIEGRGVSDPLVLAAMRTVPRELFVAKHAKDQAYEDRPLPIGAGQTISQPYIVAFMVEALGAKGRRKGAGDRCRLRLRGGRARPRSRAKFSRSSVSVSLPSARRTTLQMPALINVHVRHADGTEGWAEEAPFDAILVSAGAPDVPKSLMHQLKIGGHLVVPVGSDPRAQELIRITRRTRTNTTVRISPTCASCR